MKQKIRVSMIGALILIIGAVALITGCPQANGNKDKKENTTINNGGNIGNNGGNTGNNAGNIGGNTGSPLDEVIMVTGGTDNDLRTYYFSKGVVYYVQCYNAGAVAKSIRGSYSGNSITGTSLGGTVICTVKPTKVTIFFDTGNSRDFRRITEGESLYNIIKNAPVNR